MSSSPQLRSSPSRLAGMAAPSCPASRSPATAVQKSRRFQARASSGHSRKLPQQPRAAAAQVVQETAGLSATESIEEQPEFLPRRTPRQSPAPTSIRKLLPRRLPSSTSPSKPLPPTASIRSLPANSARALPCSKPQSKTLSSSRSRNPRGRYHTPTHSITPTPDEPIAPTQPRAGRCCPRKVRLADPPLTRPRSS